uniref:Lipid scramblase CLPTM1L n=1 Tax=Steinernema glaseri TaxID=37863 RepID=A0A1I7ZRJ4_9BILA
MSLLSRIFSFSSILAVLFAIYISYALQGIYELFHPELCTDLHTKSECLFPMITNNEESKWPSLQLRIYMSSSSKAEYAMKKGSEVLRISRFDIGESVDETVKLDIPKTARNNGSLYIHSFLLPAEHKHADPHKSVWKVVKSSRFTEFRVPKAEIFKLMTASEKQAAQAETYSAQNLRSSGTPVTHIRSVLPLAVVAESPRFLRKKVPAELYDQLQLTTQNDQVHYLPLFMIDQMGYRERDLVHVKPDLTTIDLKIQYRPVTVGKMRLLLSTQQSFGHLKGFGFSDHDIDEVKGIYADTNFYLLAATIFVGGSHLLFDILAFKNDISFWRNRKNMVGLSRRALLWRCFSQFVVFLYLYDQKTSLLVLIPSGLAVLVEAWKVTIALRITVSMNYGIPRISCGPASKAEEQSDGFDSQAMQYLTHLLVPLCMAGSLYSLAYFPHNLAYFPHKSWYSWLLQSAANGVYAFGFLFMLPQLFVNYKLKSVAHLPWRAFMYKAFNTFIDDLFAFIITMPTAHRVACFRDDIVFLVYLYQRYLYPVDKTMANEYGESVEEETEESKKTK